MKEIGGEIGWDMWEKLRNRNGSSKRRELGQTGWKETEEEGQTGDRGRIDRRGR